MPHNWEYVAAAYGIWTLIFAAYIVWLVRRSSVVERALRRLGEGPRQGTGARPGERPSGR